MNEAVMKAFNEMSKAKYEVDDALNKFDQARNAYNEAIMNECIENILNVLKEEGKLTERDLKIFLSDLLTTVTSQY
jgi:hypothetical protein